ncbi:MAG TPA: hypothetical protein VHA09_04135 [Nitrososphaera sp.]|nr:hypothetical protein [Nitrososphaera sp.]
MFSLAERLVALSTTILAGALASRIVFGGVMGFIGRIATSSGEILGEQEREEDEGQQKTRTLGSSSVMAT